MKRFLIISLVVVLAVVMMAVPALAATPYEVTECCNGPSIDLLPPEGFYVVRFTFYDGVTKEYKHCQTNPFYWNAESIEGDYSVVESAFIHEGESVGVQVGLYSDCGCGFYGILLRTLSGDPITRDTVSWESYEPGDEGGAAGSALRSTDSIFAVFAGVGTWLVAELGNVTALFYHADTGLTLLGVLAVCGLGFAVIFLLISWIRNLLHFRS